MFSGIVEEFAEVVALEKEQENLHLTLKCSFVDELKIDQSVAHNGVCLTVVKIFEFFLIELVVHAVANCFLKTLQLECFNLLATHGLEFRIKIA